MDAKEQKNAFDAVMVQVGDSGKFQKWYNIIYNLFFACFATLANFNIYISLATPEHWCDVPGRSLTNYSAEEWKELTIPRSNNIYGDFSQCKMFNITNDIIDRNVTIECVNGWDYNRTYFVQTIVSQENWVCKDEILNTNLLFFGRVGEVLGTALAQIGDIYGRKFVLLFSTISVIIGRLGFLISSQKYWLYCVFMVIGSLANIALFQSILVISLEISRDEDRSRIPLLQLFAWSAGLCISPLMYSILGTWTPFLVLTTLPLLPFLFMQKYNIESPRWLHTKGNPKKCVKQLRRIAKINKNDVSDSVFQSLYEDQEIMVVEKSYGVMSMFSTRSLAKKSILLMFSWIAYVTIYTILYINVSNLKGNPFMNYFWQGLAELPGFFIGKYLSDKIGRRLTIFSSFLGMTLIGLIMAYTLSVSSGVTIVAACGVLMKVAASITFYGLNLQTLEIFPTCLRQTGSSIAQMSGSLFGIAAPYLIYLGTTIHLSLPYIGIASLALMGALFNIFLPETLNERLPETIAEAEIFGADQKLCSLPKRKL